MEVSRSQKAVPACWRLAPLHHLQPGELMRSTVNKYLQALPAYLPEDEGVHGAPVLCTHLQGPLPVVDDNQKVVGALSVVGATKMPKLLTA